MEESTHSGDWNGTPNHPAVHAFTAHASVEHEFRSLLASAGMCQALAMLNARTRYRFTGVYRVDPPLLRNEHLFDRENPSLSLGGNVRPLHDTYCGIVAATEASFAVADAHTDTRLATHSARDSVVSYIGVPVRGKDGRIIATVCHFDLRPRILPLDELAILESISRDIANWLAEADRTRA